MGTDLALDDDLTIIVEPYQGVAEARAAFVGNNALAPGTRLGELEIQGLIAEGGFGIVYAAYDHSLGRTVALKEYMPSVLATRIGPTTVAPKSRSHSDTYDAGLSSFINEARLLALFDHPSLVKVYRFWQANGTAYMVMPLYEGVTLKDALRSGSYRPDEAWLKTVIVQLLEVLRVLHAAHCYHRDIAPDNILILRDGRALLLDFGAARQVIGDMTQALTVILKPGYAPIEQYTETSSLRQGPWTDLYALGAVVHLAITGTPPVPSVGRTVADPYRPLARKAKHRYSGDFLAAIDRALNVLPAARPQSVAEFAQLLGVELSADSPHEQSMQLRAASRRMAKPTRKMRALFAVGSVALAITIGGAYVRKHDDDVWSSLLPRPAPGGLEITHPLWPPLDVSTLGFGIDAASPARPPAQREARPKPPTNPPGRIPDGPVRVRWESKPSSSIAAAPTVPTAKTPPEYTNKCGPELHDATVHRSDDNVNSLQNCRSSVM